MWVNRLGPAFDANAYLLSVNIYGWRRLQTSPDGKVTNANCTIWKHDDIFRNCVGQALPFSSIKFDNGVPSSPKTA